MVVIVLQKSVLKVVMMVAIQVDLQKLVQIVNMTLLLMDLSAVILLGMSSVLIVQP